MQLANISGQNNKGIASSHEQNLFFPFHTEIAPRRAFMAPNVRVLFQSKIISEIEM